MAGKERVCAIDEQSRHAANSRLQLLDPQRYSRFEDFEQETERLRRVSRFVDEALEAASAGSTDLHTDRSLAVPAEVLSALDGNPAGRVGDARQRNIASVRRMNRVMGADATGLAG